MAAEQRDVIWRRIEAEAHEQAVAEIEREASTPLVFGQFIAWVYTAYKGVTDGVSSVHRVGYPKNGEPFTTCGETIPNPTLWLPLSGMMAKRMPHCRFCEAEHHRMIHEGERHAA